MKGRKVMIPHVHDDERQRGERAPLPPLEGKRPSPPAPWRRSRNLLQRAIGVLLLFVVGLATPAVDTALGAAFFAVLGAAWLDTWWACLLVPLALVTGNALRQLPSSGLTFESTLLLTLSALLGAALGTIFFKRRDIRRWMKL
jgi:hypothetical protein